MCPSWAQSTGSCSSCLHLHSAIKPPWNLSSMQGTACTSLDLGAGNRAGAAYAWWPCMALSSSELQRGSMGMLLWLVVHNSDNGILVGMSALTVSLVAQHLWPFISVPNFSPLLCSAVPMFNANCPFPPEPLPAMLRVQMGSKTSFYHVLPPMGLSGDVSVSSDCPPSSRPQQHLGGAQDAARLQGRLPCPTVE